ncbi:radical SAM/SPASM domain-containing protein [Streptomyces sp. NPDC051554]|uniref:radical SAM/SPASM domain-containing protein n=1 Tax=Streptomyces sp. NPDC051554 TaxID=3365656 RepID=UPI0037888967
MTGYSAPVRASVDVTYACDLRCIHCRTNTGEIPAHIRRKMLSIEQLSDVMYELDAMGTFEITLTGGEPTIRKGFWELTDTIPNIHFSTVTLITNAARLSHEQMDRIIGSGIRAIRVSIDGTREMFEKIRLVDAFDQVIENSAYLNERATSFRILTTVMKTNLHNVFDLTALLRRQGFRRQNYILVRAHGRGARNNLLLTEAETMELHAKVEQFRLRVPDSEFNLRLNAPYLVAEDIPAHQDVVMFPYIVRDSSIAISATGDVTMSRLYSSKPLGNVKERSIKEIWSEAQEQLAEEAVEHSDDELRRIFWNFAAAEESEGIPIKLTSLLDRQVFEGYEVR